MSQTTTIQLELFDMPTAIRSTRRKSVPKFTQRDRDSYGRIVGQDQSVDEATKRETETRKQISISNTLRLQAEKIIELTKKLHDHGIK